MARRPNDSRAAGQQGLDQVHIFMGRQRGKAAYTLVGLGAHAKVGAMDMPMILTGLVAVAISPA
jgi:hypothetical protein